MIKKIIALCLLASLLVGCGKPSNVSEDVYNLGLKAVDVTEQFLSADLTADEAKEKLEEIESRIIPDEEYQNDSSIKTRVSLIYSLVYQVDDKPSEDEIKEIKEWINKLKEKL